MKFTAIDFETANSARTSACSVGLAIVEDGQIVRQHHRLIRPTPFQFAPYNVRKHGITAADVEDAPAFAEVWEAIRPKIEGPLVAHNAAFDMSVLRSSLDLLGQNCPEMDYFCTLVIARHAWPEYPTYSLSYIAATLGIEFKHHEAEEDAIACARIALAACQKFNVPSLEALQDVCKLRIGRLFAGGHISCGVPPKPIARTPGNHGVKAADIARSSDVSGEQHPCMGMAFVFTGTFSSMRQQDAMQAVADRGGICHDAVKTTTDYLVVGQEGYSHHYGAGYKSGKMQKAEVMRAKGRGIEILSEDDFLSML